MKPPQPEEERFVQLVASKGSAVWGLTSCGRIFRNQLPLPDFENWPRQPEVKP